MKNKKTKNKIKLLEINISFKSSFKLFFFIFFLPVFISKKIIFNIRKLNSNSEIIITIEGTGNQYFIWQYAQSVPNSVSVQNSPDISCNQRQALNLVNNINNISTIWPSQPLNFYRLFFYLTYITHVYFLDFDSSKLERMDQMFNGCSNLRFVSFNNINLSSVTTMNSMFLNCQSLTSIDLSNLVASKVTNMNEMFSGCKSITYLNLSNFDSFSLENMEKMFYQCTSLQTIDFTNFNTSNVINMGYTFYGCKSLESLDLNNFITKKVQNMGGLFRECQKLKYIDLSNFDTSSVTSMTGMFQSSNSIISLDLSNFDTSSVKKMDNMFYSCTSLEKINLNNFDVKSVTTMNSMFWCCESLTTLDLSSFITSSLKDTKSCFENCKSLISLNIINFDASVLEEMSLMFFGCENLISLNLQNFEPLIVSNGSHHIFTKVNSQLIFCGNSSKLSRISSQISFSSECENTCFDENQKLLVEKKGCTNNCSNDETNNFEYNNICYKTCPDDTHVTSDNKFLCQKPIEGYYLDNDIYKKCYYSCKICEGEGNDNNHNCEVCIPNFRFINDIGKENNCYKHCEYYYYYNSSIYQCTLHNECPEEYDKLIESKGKCINECSEDDTYKYEYNKKCYRQCPNETYAKSDNEYLCFKDPDGYYLDINIYKPCYSSCKKCEGEGNSINNNCLECKLNYKFINETDKANNCYSDCGDLYYYFNNSGNYLCTINKECPDEYNKLIPEKSKCIDNCSKDNNYILEFENTCYKKCPNNSYLSIDNNYLCRKDPEGYYLDTDIYKPCYELCKNCYGEGNDNNHNCKECINNYKFISIGGIQNNCYEKCDNYYFDSSGNYHCSSDNNCPEEQSKFIQNKSVCIDNCENDDTYKLEYNNQCYQTCPGNTHITSDNQKLCQLNPEGYYLNNDIYEKCYYSCKICKGEGNENNHNCEECKENFIFINEIGKGNNCYEKCENYYYFDNSGNYECINECKEDYSKIVIEKKKCIDKCDNDDTYKLEYDNKCYEICPNNTFVTSDNIKICKLNPEGYYLDTDIYKPCYELCKNCYGEGNDNNHNCKECIDNYKFILDPENIQNCYPECNYYYYFDKTNKYKCTNGFECPEEQKNLITEKYKCIDNCEKDDIYKFEDNDVCVKFLPDKNFVLICPIFQPFEKNQECIEKCSVVDFLNKECKLNNKTNKTAQDMMIQEIKTEISNGNLSDIISNVKNTKKDYIAGDKDITYQITSSENQNKNNYNNISKIILGECEEKLRKHYGIKDDESFIIFKVDVHEEGLLIPLIEYEIYNPIDLEKVNLSLCIDTKIGISIPVDIDENNLFKYNSSHEYYNDICYPYTTESGTDIIIDDRQKEYKTNNYSLCESNCEYTNYNLTTKQVLCECNPKLNLNSLSDIKDNKDKLLKSFMDIKSIINLKLIKCYKKFLNKEGLLTNIGSYILLSILFIYLVSIFIFKFKGFTLIYKQIQQLVKLKSQNIKDQNAKQKLGKNSMNIYNRNKTNQSSKKAPKSTKKLKTLIKSKKLVNPPYKRRKVKSSKKVGISEDFTIKSNSKMELKYTEKRLMVKKKLSQRMPLIKKHVNNILEKDNGIDNNKISHNFQNFINKMKISNYNDYELNSLLYEEALDIDKRTYLKYYASLLRQKHLVIFTFFTNNDYNSRIIKICLFFFSLSLYLSVNALFFNYTIINKIYEDKGKYNFIYQIPQILYSTMICAVVNMAAKTLSLSQKDIVEFKRENDNILDKASKLIKGLSIKFVLFFLFSFIFLFLFWFYLGCFCAVYKNTQIHLIQDALISFALTLVYPIFYNFLPGFFRISSLRTVNKDKECLYKFSQIIQLI